MECRWRFQTKRVNESPKGRRQNALHPRMSPSIPCCIMCWSILPRECIFVSPFEIFHAFLIKNEINTWGKKAHACRQQEVTYTMFIARTAASRALPKEFDLQVTARHELHLHASCFFLRSLQDPNLALHLSPAHETHTKR